MQKSELLSDLSFISIVHSSGTNKDEFLYLTFVSFIRGTVMLDFFKGATKMLWENKCRFCLVFAKLLRDNRLAKIMCAPTGKN